MNSKLSTVLLLVAFVILTLSKSVYTVKETERAVLLRFGKVVDADLKPGLGFKIPYVHEVRRFDARILTLELKSEEYLTQEKKRLIVDSFVMWQISDVAKFFTATGGLTNNAQRLLAPRVNEGLRNKFGERKVHEVVSGEREQLMVELTQEINQHTLTQFGIKMLDIRVKKIDLPPTVSESVYNRMRAEREREAREHRSKGKELAEGIRADADRQVRIIQAEAYRKAEVIRGEGDAESAAIYSNVYSQERDFYAFYRSMIAYKNTFRAPNDIMLVSPNHDFFRYMTSAPSK